MMHTKKSITTSLPIQDLDEGKYRGQWLVIAGATGAIVAHADRLEDVQKEAVDRSVENPAFYKVPSTDTHYVSIR
ncbi:MAG: hypothetical protein A3E36_03825 [Candidatus Andersenbacteria bacterium RIFCSPHIGHO2_12_FULL_45_11b]|uniref:Uncharacterized protein n=1 Tax=Candidatus Andersenbacteria bacterium RIFCSPHIGHO2_12_FULL_45_11b TaxID=1797282 RepID=A0A1G1XA94_9BACT|nr:MAG: hypothetical protein A3E36_03825 [Candidatus Andersenbacteria bacterium RIFCSPHIGHO2_12_FULL_45_11b]